MGKLLIPFVLVLPFAALQPAPASLTFAVLGGFGTGTRAQYELAGQMGRLHKRTPYDLVVLVGGNLFGGERPRDFIEKFETPYKPLLAAGVTFHASLGDEDSREQRFYKHFNMGGKLYYTFSPKPSVRFFALDANAKDAAQVQWLEQQLRASSEPWKIAFFHHPLYSSGGAGPDEQLRALLEPLFIKHNVSVVLTGRDRFYERVKPQQDVTYFIVGSGGQLQRGGLDARSGLTAKGFDTDHAFLTAEIIGDEMRFAAISRTGETVDSGVVRRRGAR